MFCPWIFGSSFLSSHFAVFFFIDPIWFIIIFFYSGISMNNSCVDSDLAKRFSELLLMFTTFPLQVYCWCVQFSACGKHLLFSLFTAPLLLGTAHPSSGSWFSPTLSTMPGLCHSTPSLLGHLVYATVLHATFRAPGWD